MNRYLKIRDKCNDAVRGRRPLREGGGQRCNNTLYGGLELTPALKVAGTRAEEEGGRERSPRTHHHAITLCAEALRRGRGKEDQGRGGRRKGEVTAHHHAIILREIITGRYDNKGFTGGPARERRSRRAGGS